MPIYLHERYAKDIDQKFTLESLLAGKCSTKYTFEGVKTVNISTIVPQALNDYTRSGANRYGTPKEVEDTIQSLTLGNDQAFSMTVDKGNNTEQQAIKNAGAVLKVEMEEIVIPTVDTVAIRKWTKFAGKVATVTAALTKSTVLPEIVKARTHFVNNKIKMAMGNIYLGVPASTYALLLQTTEFVQADKLNEKVLSNGVVGKVFNMLVVEIPDDYFEEGVQFIVWKSDSVLMPKKLWDTKVHMDPPGLSGHLLEGRFIYDAFVLAEKAQGVYACVLSTNKLATPTITTSGKTIACSGATTIMYTNDGSDPRYSKTAKVYSTAYEASSGDVIKAVGMADGKFTSDVAEGKQ